MTTRILVVDDDPGLRDLLAGYLQAASFDVTTVAEGRAMKAALARDPYDLLILDLMLPGEDGLALCRQLRATSSVPIIMLTARGDELDRVVGIEMGADDYLTKPFSARELLARARSILRRAGSRAGPNSQIRFGGWILDLGARFLRDPAGVVVSLSTGEFRLLRALAENIDRVMSRDQLLDAVSGRDASPNDRSIDVLIARLRRRLRDEAREPQLLRTVRGEGYMLVSGSE